MEKLIFDINKVFDKTHISEFAFEIKKIIFRDMCIHVNKHGDLDRAKFLFSKFISSDENKLNAFFSKIEEIKDKLYDDILFTFESDPACNGYEEIVITYPGFSAIFAHRIAHELFLLDLKVPARIIAEEAHVNTGIDIHPGATIGCPFFIDHGTGIVIGETTIIGHHCKLYQGVTLGALSLGRGQKLKSTKRHPTIGNYVTIYAGASILGGDVTIGDNVVIGSNVFLIESIPSNHKVKLPNCELVVFKKDK